MNFINQLLKHPTVQGSLWLVNTQPYKSFSGEPESPVTAEKFESLLPLEVYPIKVKSGN
jgi:hypothetical protein